MSLELAQLKELLHYEPPTGVWTWLVQYNSRTSVGLVAGFFDAAGYRRIQIGGKHYRSGRLAWFYMTGKWPVCLIDHEDRNKANDAWDNLREADYRESTHNRGMPVGVAGLRGVRRCYANPHRWEARIAIGNTRRSLGSFDTPEEAHAVYLVAAEELHGKFAPHVSEAKTIERRF